MEADSWAEVFLSNSILVASSVTSSAYGARIDCQSDAHACHELTRYIAKIVSLIPLQAAKAHCTRKVPRSHHSIIVRCFDNPWAENRYIQVPPQDHQGLSKFAMKIETVNRRESSLERLAFHARWCRCSSSQWQRTLVYSTDVAKIPWCRVGNFRKATGHGQGTAPLTQWSVRTLGY